MQISGIAHGHEYIPWPDAHRTAAEFLISIDPELIELFRLSVPRLSDVPFRERKDREEHAAEDHSSNGRLRLGEQVHNRGDEQDRRDRRQAQRNLDIPDVQISCHFPLTMTRLCEAQ